MNIFGLAMGNVRLFLFLTFVGR